MNTEDYRCIQAFFGLQPTKEEISSAKVIWQATMKKQQQENYLAVLKQRIYTKRLPASFSLLDHSIDSTKKMLTQPGLSNDKRVTLADRRQKTIAQFKYDLMAIQITTVEEILRSHLNIIAEEKNKLVASAHGQMPLPEHLVAILHAIAQRQKQIVARLDFANKKTLSCFDDAPMAIDEDVVARTIGAMS